ncbi:hypothetical protein G9A89_013348 [Geosiphon pyriformis]|nr:hypothetical protein G9A89_013348 [Geosiphon pyriformis]
MGTLRGSLGQTRDFTREAEKVVEEREDPHNKLINLIQRSTVMKTASGVGVRTQETPARFNKIFMAGQVYKPLDLSEASPLSGKPRFKKSKPTTDVFKILKINPLFEYKNFNLLSGFVSDMGRILPRSQTGITKKNQRRLTKAINRARSFGLLPSTHRRPLVETHQYLEGTQRGSTFDQKHFDF